MHFVNTKDENTGGVIDLSLPAITDKSESGKTILSHSVLDFSIETMLSAQHSVKQSIPKQKNPGSNDKRDYKIVKHEVLSFAEKKYEVLKFLGKGTFGQVFKCLKRNTKEFVAIKILKSDPIYAKQRDAEVKILTYLSKENADKHNIICATEYFSLRKRICIVFELLDQSLYDFLKGRSFCGIRLNNIRLITKQILEALCKLKELGIIHSDIKPGNIMLVNHQNQPYRVKVIDFGSARYPLDAVYPCYIQTRYYRAPEIILGLPFWECIDMWSLACVMAELFLGRPLYPGSSEYDQIRFITNTQGLPSTKQCNEGMKTTDFFQRDNTAVGGWKLKSATEYQKATGIKPKETKKVSLPSLDALIQRNQPQVNSNDKLATEVDQRVEFINLLRKMLTLEAENRIEPEEAMIHPFITMPHLDSNSKLQVVFSLCC